MADNNNFNNYMEAAGLGTAAGGLAQLLFGGQNPSDAANQYFNQIPDMMKPYYQPYIDSGQNAMGVLNTQYGNMVNNPTGMMNSIGAGYQQSPGYQYQVNQATGAANRAAAAGGMLGSPSEQQALAGNVNQMANQDYYNYVDRGMQNYNQGIQGYQGMNTQGYNASNELAQSLANALMTQGSLAYAGQANKNSSKGGGFGDLIGGVASSIPFL